MCFWRRLWFMLLTTIGMMLPAVAQTPGEKVDLEMIEKIKEEGLKKSQIMDTISYLTDIHGPRLTGSPITRRAGNWTVERLNQWGLSEAHLESWGPFGRGWTLEAFTANMVEPNYVPLIAFPKAWSPSTPKTIRGEPIYLYADKSADLDKYRGKLHRAIVLISPPREVAAQFEPAAVRKSDTELLELANADPQARRRSSSSSLNSGSASGSSGSTTNRTAAGSQEPAKPAEPSRSSTQLLADKWQLAYDEGAAVVLEPGRGDGGTVFLTAVTLPRKADAERNARDGQGDNSLSRGPRPWVVPESEILPQVVVAVEHYNRLIRMLQKGEHPQVEIDIASRFHAEDQNSFNVIAEIPGSDLKHEVVMLGAHFDSWHSGTGATDNAAGCGVVLEAIRILKAVGAQPRRTVRVALWTGEEQGLLGSRAYVAKHFGNTVTPVSDKPEKTDKTAEQNAASAAAAAKDKSEASRTVYELKPEYETLSAYFNLDNGSGKIRGIYLQGNEAVRPIFRAWLKPFADMGAATVSPANTGGTDHLSFDGIGLPGFQFIQDQLEYNTRTHHSNMDTWERIQADDVKQSAVVMASFVYHAAVRDEKLPRKALDGEIKQAAAVAAPLPAVQAVPAAGATAR